MEAVGPVRRVAVIGAGGRGRVFALRCLRAGFEVVLEDVLPSRLRLAEEDFAGEPAAVRARLRLAASVEEAVRAADVAVDFVPDELESKLEIFCMMDRMAPPRTIFCTPTGLSIGDLASCTYRAERCVGLAVGGGESWAAVTLVRGAATAEAAVARVTEWLEALGVTVEVRVEAAARGAEAAS